MIILILVFVFFFIFIDKTLEYNTDKNTKKFRNFLLFNSDNQKVFQNFTNFFKYYPESKITIANYYLGDNDEINIEYHYSFHTNNFGLNQKQNIDIKKEYILILGNSFAEGQGAPPWFEKFIKLNTNKKNNYINGAIFGTGFAQHVNLHDYLIKQNIKIKKIILIFGSYDIERQPFIISDSILSCVEKYKCSSNDIFFPLSIDIRQNKDLLKKIVENDSNKDFFVKDYIKSKLPNIYLIYKKIRFLTINRLVNKQAILKLKQIYNLENNLIFINVPQASEVINQKLVKSGQYTMELLKKNNIKAFTMLKDCNFIPSDYHKNDGHLNAVGYSKFVKCLNRINLNQ